MEVSYVQYVQLLQNQTEAFGSFETLLNVVTSGHSLKTSILVQVTAEEAKVDGQSEGKSFRARPFRCHVQPEAGRMPFMMSVGMALCLETRHATEPCSNVSSAVI